MFWKDVLDRNARWADAYTNVDPTFFQRSAAEHSPRAYWVGCSDARVAANLVSDTAVGELFVHRNIANQVLPADASLAAGLQYAVDVLGVDDVMVVGHHACGGVMAALSAEQAPGHVEAWIAQLRMLARLHRAELNTLPLVQRVNRLAELNVAEQAANLARNPTLRRAWSAGRDIRVHGWVYSLATGLLTPTVLIDSSVASEYTDMLSGVAAQAK